MTHPVFQVREEIKQIVKAWMFENRGSVDDLTGAIYDYIIATYGPPF